MKISSVKLICLSIVTIALLQSSCKVNSGYGCDYTEVSEPKVQPLENQEATTDYLCKDYTVVSKFSIE